MIELVAVPNDLPLAGRRLQPALRITQYNPTMSPTIFREGSFRFFFFSREEPRMHVHVSHPDGEAKFWVLPDLILATSTGLSPKQIKEAQRLVVVHMEEITHAWHTHFPS